MKVFKCDGETYYGNNKCKNITQNELPKTWFVIDGHMHSGLPNRKMIKHNGEKHFCSKDCLMSYLFKDRPTYDDLRVYLNFFKAGVGIKEEEINDKFQEFCKGRLKNYDEVDFNDISRILNELKEC